MEGGIIPMNSNNHQLFIEGKSNQLFVYVYLTEFKKRNALLILDHYIHRHKNENFKSVKVIFWNMVIPGEFLSMFRRNINRKCTKFLLRGASYIEASFDYMNRIKTLNNPVTVN